MSGLLPPGPPPDHPPPDHPPQPPVERNRLALVVAAAIAAVLVIALAIGIPVALRSDSGSGPESESRTAGPANLDDVKVYTGLANDHTADEVAYPQVPPVGGPHDPAWLDCGVYDEQVRNENAVHDLEHGATWLTYDPGLGLGADEIEALAEKLGHNSIVSPYAGLPAPVVVTVWGRQLELDGTDDPRLGLFLAAYGDGHTSPEPFASCAGGIDNPGPEEDPSGTSGVDV